MTTVAIIPARGGSQGVNRKVMQLVDGLPLVYRAARLARDLRRVDRVVVSTEDPEVASYCRLRGIEVLDRPAHLSDPTVTLAQVLQHAASVLPGDTFLVLQPTCPLLHPYDLDGCLEEFEVARASGVGAAFVVYPDTHQTWQDGRRLVPHVNRQQVPEHKRLYRETGVRITTRKYALAMTGLEGVLELDSVDGVLDIDTYEDLVLAERELRKKHVAFQCVASPELGTGHLYRCLRLADRLRREHFVTLEVVDYRAGWIDQLIRSRGLHGTVAPGRYPDLLVLDTLDLYDSRIISSLQHEVPVISLENESEVAAKHATAVVNELLTPDRGLSGPKYAVLREEFTALPLKDAPEEVRRVFLTFGGADPAGLAARVVGLKVLQAPNLEVRVAQGPAAVVRPTPRDGLIVVEGAHMAEEMHQADLIITSQGRTQYEAAASGTPTITIAANERESRHYRTSGQLHLPVHAGVSDVHLNEMVDSVMASRALREEMATTARGQVDGKGVERLAWLFEGVLRGL